MPEFLLCTVDKFIFKVAVDCFYTPDGVWVRAEGDQVRLGISDFLQQSSGDVAFAEVMEASTILTRGDEFANIETIKVDISLPSPVSGVIAAVNPDLEMEAEIINQDPYGAGWLALVKPENWLADRALLLDPNSYFELMKSEAEKEMS